MARQKWRSLLGIEHLSPEDITHILRLAKRFDGKRARPLLRDRRIALLFYEASTRTRVSFEFAAKALGASTAVILATASSVEKGESLIDTGRTLRAMDLDAIVVRHPSSGAPNVLARDLNIPIINAGDGLHEHPTQALLDAYTILQRKKKLTGLRVAVVGDIYHSRVARSGVFLLSKFGAQITLCGPPEFVPDLATTLAKGVRVSRYIEDALRGADVVMMLRVQKERLAGRKIDFGNYIANYQLTPERLRLAKRDAILMHPGPMVRGLELTSEAADGPHSVITQQVHNGVHVRMAVLAHCMGVA